MVYRYKFLLALGHDIVAMGAENTYEIREFPVLVLRW